MAEVKLATDWLAEKQQLQSGQAKSDDPVLLSADIAKEEALKRFTAHPGAAQAGAAAAKRPGARRRRPRFRSPWTRTARRRRPSRRRTTSS